MELVNIVRIIYDKENVHFIGIKYTEVLECCIYVIMHIIGEKNYI